MPCSRAWHAVCKSALVAGRYGRRRFHTTANDPRLQMIRSKLSFRALLLRCAPLAAIAVLGISVCASVGCGVSTQDDAMSESAASAGNCSNGGYGYGYGPGYN